jgi:tetratricopeptide (TPR) repeat protein
MTMIRNFRIAFAISAALSLAAVPSVWAVGTETQTPAASSEYPAAKTAVDAQKYQKAITLLLKVVKADKKNADAWNLLGYSSRKLSRFKDAAKYYDVALKLNPKHLAALEYQGELFVETGAMAKAKANLAQLSKLCGNCEEYRDLKKTISKAGS